MASLPGQHPSLSLLLTDRTLTPIISSTASSANANRQAALETLASTALAAHACSLRLGLGNPVRIMVESDGHGPVVLSSMLDPEAVSSPVSLLNGSQEASDTQRTGDTTLVDIDIDMREDHAGRSDDSHNAPHTTPMLVGVVVAPHEDYASEARRAASRLERVGRQFQTALAEEQRREQDDGPE